LLEKLKWDLVIEYDGESLEETFDASRVTAAGSEALEISHERRLRLRRPDVRPHILSDLKLVRGVGPMTERLLKSEGYHTIMDLMEHEVHGVEAARILDFIESLDFQGIRGYLNCSSSDPRLVGAIGLACEESFTFLDIETLGLGGEPVILAGMAWIEDGRIKVMQRLAPAPEMEGAVLEIYHHIPPESIIVTFNGASFDIPYIRRRSAIHGLENRLQNCHVDLYHISRRLWGHRLPNCKLSTVERHILGAERGLDIPGSYVPDYYRTYLSTGSPGPLVLLVEHNREDIINMALLIPHVTSAIC